MLFKEDYREIYLVLLSIAISFIFQPLQKISNSLFTISWGLTVNDWIGTITMAFAIWLILKHLRTINNRIEKERTDQLIKSISQAFEKATETQTNKVLAAIKELKQKNE